MTCYSWEDLSKPLALIGASFVGEAERWLIISSYIVRLLWDCGIKIFTSWDGVGSARQYLWYDGVSFKCFGNSIRGKTLWRIVCLSLLWIVWKKKNVRIFKDIWKTLEMMWDHFYVSFLAHCTNIFKPYPLSVIQLSWLLICTPYGWVYRVRRYHTCISLLYLLYSLPWLVKVYLVLSIRFVHHGEDSSSFSCFF